jgi:tetratricopeptide (TPR) repeat protein
MERKKYFIILLVSLLFTTIASAKSYKQQIYEAYISGDMNRWRSIVLNMEKAENYSDAFRLELINYQYGYIGWCVGTGRKNEAKQWMEKMQANMDILEKKQFEPASIEAYKAAMIGFRVGINKLQAPFIGPKSVEYAKNAMKADPQNPMGFLQYANILHFTPGLFGGSDVEAMKHYTLALRKMESKTNIYRNNWNYLSLLAAIATAYYEYNQKEKAIEYLRKALQVEPGFQWVSKELLPKYLKNK